jgi:hypothetical protein
VLPDWVWLFDLASLSIGKTTASVTGTAGLRTDKFNGRIADFSGSFDNS